MSFNFFRLLILVLIMGPVALTAQEPQTARLTLLFINNIDTQVSINQMKNPATGLTHASLMGKIDTEGKVYFEFTINQLTDFYWQSKVNQLGGQITLAPGDDLTMSIDRD